jgi:hypothetical protein
MSKKVSRTRRPRKHFDVVYSVEQGYTIRVSACSAENAERNVLRRLDEVRHVLDGSTLGHHEHLLFAAYEVKP